MQLGIYTINEAAHKLGVNHQTIRKGIKQGKLTAQRLGNLWVVLEDERFRNFTLGPGGRPTWKSQTSKAKAKKGEKKA